MIGWYRAGIYEMRYSVNGVDILYTCELCDKTMRVQSKKNHEKSKRHILRVNDAHMSTMKPAEYEECSICLEPIYVCVECMKCKNEWCGSCDVNIFKCPFCRTIVFGRDRQSEERDSILNHEYSNAEVMVPTQRTIYRLNFVLNFRDLLEMLY